MIRRTLAVSLLCGMLLVLSSLLAIAQSTTQPDQGMQSSGPPPLAPMDVLQKMHDNGDYRACLQQIARVLQLNDPAAKGYNRAGLYLLRGDCLVHLKDHRTATDAYMAAQKADPNPQQMAESRAMAVLIPRSRDLVYMTRDSNNPNGISIIDPNGRKVAMLALFDDELQRSQDEVARAKNAKDLVPIQNALPKLEDLYALEMAATGNATRIRPTLSAVGERARDLIEKELAKIDGQIGSVESLANQTDAVYGNIGGGMWTSYGAQRRGLMPDERQGLRDLIDYARRVADASQEGENISRMLGGNVEAWQQVVSNSLQVIGHAQRVLAAE